MSRAIRLFLVSYCGLRRGYRLAFFCRRHTDSSQRIAYIGLLIRLEGHLFQQGRNIENRPFDGGSTAMATDETPL